VDLAAYFQRIDYLGRPVADRSTLADIVLCHVQHIPFENLNAFLQRGVQLDPLIVERKLVHEGRGGWCFEQNLLLGMALRLREVGFR
jgi:N-hydroxyarylamine O-acetyltransferase